jgi:hypothetical protein
MKRDYFLIILIGSLNIFACSSSKIATIPINKANDSINTYRIIVSFISTGQGLDIKAKGEFKNYISNFEQSQNVKISYEEIHWGREGEVDYCMMLKELNSVQQNSFVDGLKTMFISNKLIFIKENSPYMNIRK